MPLGWSVGVWDDVSSSRQQLLLGSCFGVRLRGKKHCLDVKSCLAVLAELTPPASGDIFAPGIPCTLLGCARKELGPKPA